MMMKAAEAECGLGWAPGPSSRTRGSSGVMWGGAKDKSKGGQGFEFYRPHFKP